jgi:hypothetical protein
MVNRSDGIGTTPIGNRILHGMNLLGGKAPFLAASIAKKQQLHQTRRNGASRRPLKNETMQKWGRMNFA